MINGRDLMKRAQNEGTVDNCHPNDLGFMSMAKVLGDLLKKLIITDEMGRGMAEHCCIEYRNLCEILPTLYAEYAENN